MTNKDLITYCIKTVRKRYGYRIGNVPLVDPSTWRCCPIGAVFLMEKQDQLTKDFMISFMSGFDGGSVNIDKEGYELGKWYRG